MKNCILIILLTIFFCSCEKEQSIIFQEKQTYSLTIERNCWRWLNDANCWTKQVYFIQKDTSLTTMEYFSINKSVKYALFQKYPTDEYELKLYEIWHLNAK